MGKQPAAESGGINWKVILPIAIVAALVVGILISQISGPAKVSEEAAKAPEAIPADPAKLMPPAAPAGAGGAPMLPGPGGGGLMPPPPGGAGGAPMTPPPP